MNTIKPAKPAAIHFRLTDEDYRQVTMLKLECKTSIQHMLEIGLNMLLASKGMKPINGVPRPIRSRYFGDMATQLHGDKATAQQHDEATEPQDDTAI